MHYAGRRRSENSPVRSALLLQDAARILRTIPDLQPVPYAGPWQPLTIQQQRERELANAMAAFRDAIRVFDAARSDMEDAKRTHTDPVMSGSKVVLAAQPYTPERMRERHEAAVARMKQRLERVQAARVRVEVARAALGLCSLSELEERAAIAAEIRGDKQAYFGPGGDGQ